MLFGAALLVIGALFVTLVADCPPDYRPGRPMLQYFGTVMNLINWSLGLIIAGALVGGLALLFWPERSIARKLVHSCAWIAASAILYFGVPWLLTGLPQCPLPRSVTQSLWP